MVRGTKGKEVVASNRKPPTRGYGTLYLSFHPLSPLSLTLLFVLIVFLSFPSREDKEKKESEVRSRNRGFSND